MPLQNRSALMLALITLFAARAESAPNPGLNPALPPQEQWARQIVALTNAERARVRLPPLKLQDNLSAAARWMAQDMADHDYLDHTDHLGRSIDPRFPSFGYEDYESISENIAGGQASPAEAVADWMKSPGHRANLLDPHLREIGVGCATNRSSHYKHYWVEDFGSRFHVYPIVINDDSGRTKSSAVHLTIYGEGWAKKMRFSNDRGAWTEWETYRANRDWTLPATPGKHTVSAELSDEDTVYRTQDEVELTAPSAAPPSLHTVSTSR